MLTISKSHIPSLCCVQNFLQPSYDLKGTICEFLRTRSDAQRNTDWDQRNRVGDRVPFLQNLKGAGESKHSVFNCHIHSWPPSVSVNRFQGSASQQGTQLHKPGHRRENYARDVQSSAPPPPASQQTEPAAISAVCFRGRAFLRTEPGWVFFVW